MKTTPLKFKIVTLICFMFCSSIRLTLAEAPQKMNYQTVVRNSAGVLLSNASIGIRISILQGSTSGTAVYVETQTASTNTNGLATIEIGGGNAVTGTFAGIDWSTGTYFIETAIDPTGGSNYSILGISQLLSVPFALHSTLSSYAFLADTAILAQSAAFANSTIMADTALISKDNYWKANGTNIYKAVSGNVGIGISAPTSFLHLSQAGGMNFQMDNTVNGASVFLSTPSGNATGGIGTGGNFDFPIFTNGGDRLTVKADGKIGIGTTNPNALLDVIEDIRIHGLTAGTGLNSNPNCTAFGNIALAANTGNTNSAFGHKTLTLNSSGYDNSAFGALTLQNNTTGAANTGFGAAALSTNTTGSGNTAIGYGANTSSANLSNAIAVGNLCSSDASNKARIGNSSISSIGGQVSWTNFSDARIKDNIEENVIGLAFIKALRPVTYHLNVDKENKLLEVENSLNWEGKYDIEKISFSGFIAQEVEQAAQKSGYDFSGVDKSGKLLGLRYSEFTVPLVKAVQEQQAQIEKLEQVIQQMQARLNVLEKN